LIHQAAEAFEGGQSFKQFLGAISPNEPADGFPLMDIGELVVGAVALRTPRMSTPAAGPSTDLILK